MARRDANEDRRQGRRRREHPRCLLALLALASCTFDASGLPPADVARADRPDLARVERGAGDRAGEPAPAATCEGKPDGALVCRFESGDAVGAAGVCQGGSFVVKRYCFQEAPCKGGLCAANAPDGCTGECAPGKVCAGFLNAGAIVTACVTPSAKNGSGGPGAPCASGTACSSGHCTAAGTCYRPCAKLADTCPARTVCGSSTIGEGGDHSVASCLAPAAEAGSPAPDLGANDKGPSE